MAIKNNSAKFAFFYLLSLISLIFTALPAGMIIFQVINKYVSDPLATYGNDFSLEMLKFAISALVIAAPVYYMTVRQINRSLLKGELDKESGLRKWLTYFILLISSVIVIGYLIGVVNSFLNGELTIKFILKMVTAITIPTLVFSYYFYDIRRDEIMPGDKKVKTFLWVFVVVVVAAFIASLFTVESPRLTRDRRADENVISSFYSIENAANEYYRINKKLPASLKELKSSQDLIDRGFSVTIGDNLNGRDFGYEIASSTAYRLCADFRTSNLDSDNQNKYSNPYPNDRGRHDKGWKCLPFAIDYSATIEAEKLSK